VRGGSPDAVDVVPVHPCARASKTRKKLLRVLQSTVPCTTAGRRAGSIELNESTEMFYRGFHSQTLESKMLASPSFLEVGQTLLQKGRHAFLLVVRGKPGMKKIVPVAQLLEKASLQLQFDGFLGC
jgi:hypothetical protein